MIIEFSLYLIYLRLFKGHSQNDVELFLKSKGGKFLIRLNLPPVLRLGGSLFGNVNEELDYRINPLV